MNIKIELEKVLARAISDWVRNGSIDDDLSSIDRKIEYPRDQKFGDYSTPFALETARLLRKSPLEIGEQLAKYMGNDPIIGRIEVVKPGFINIFLSEDFLFESVKTIIKERRDFGKCDKVVPRRVNLEFVSANPTGPLNIVSARAAAVGDTIANLLEFTGDIVDREFYINDYGNQVTLLGRSVLARIRERAGEEADFPEDGYHGEYIKDIAAHIAEQYGTEISAITDEDRLVEFIAWKSVEYNVEGQKKDLEAFNVRFKTWFSEKTLHERDRVLPMLEKLKDTVFIEEGKTFFRSTAFDDDKDRVLVRDDGRPTYFLADIAYHHEKSQRGYDLLLDIWGPDHHGHIKRLAGAMKVLGIKEKKFKILIAQQVNLLVEGETVKMSKRFGKFSTMHDLIAEIGVDVARYFFVMRSLESHLDFDLTLAKKESSENPVFYLQYAHARICSLFREAEKQGLNYEFEKADPKYLRDEESLLLMKLLSKFPEEVADAADKLEPHRITTYLMRLAQAFHRFYTEHRILTEDRERSITFLAISDAVRIVMAAGLRLVGVSAPEKM